MTTIAARIARVHTGSSVATMIHAIADDGLEHRIEVPPGMARAVVPGQVLVLHWSVHTIPDLTLAEPARPASDVVDPIDHEFDLKLSITTDTASVRDTFDEEFNALLGAARERG